MPIDDSFRPNKRSRYTPNPLPAAIYVASENSVSTLTTLSDSPQVIALNYYAPNTDHNTMRKKPGHATEKIGYCSRRHDGIRRNKNQVLLLHVFYS